MFIYISSAPHKHTYIHMCICIYIFNRQNLWKIYSKVQLTLQTCVSGFNKLLRKMLSITLNFNRTDKYTYICIYMYAYVCLLNLKIFILFAFDAQHSVTVFFVCIQFLLFAHNFFFAFCLLSSYLLIVQVFCATFAFTNLFRLTKWLGYLH